MLIWLLMLGCTQAEMEQSSKPQFLIFLVNGLRSDTDEIESAETSLINAMGRPPNIHYSAAYVSSPSKPISFASLLTGDYPSAIPICGRPGQNKSRRKLWCSEIPDSRRTLPEVFEIYGYDTGFFNADVSDLNDTRHGFSKHVKWSTNGASHTKNWWSLRQELSEWWNQETTPHMAVVSLDILSMDLKKKASRAYLNHPMTAEEKSSIYLKYPNYKAPPSSHLQWPFLSEAGATFFQESYKKEAGLTGAKIAETLHGLQEKSNVDNLWVIVTSLQGISLGEMGGIKHPEQNTAGMSGVLIDRNIRVPIMIWGPKNEPRRIDSPVEVIDLFPTLTEIAQIPQPKAIAGRDLFSGSARHRAYAEFGDMLFFRDGDWVLSFRKDMHGISSLNPKLTHALVEAAPAHVLSELGIQPGGHGESTDPSRKFELYDISADSSQSHNILANEIEVFEDKLKQMLFLRLNEAAPPKESMSFERVQELNRDGIIHYW